MSEELIEKFFQLDQSIYKAEKRLIDLEYSFYSMSYHTRTVFTEHGIGVQGSDVEKQVVEYVDTQAKLKQSQQQRIHNYQGFIRYLNTLKKRHRKYLIQKYVKGYDLKYNGFLEEKTAKAINQIEIGGKREKYQQTIERNRTAVS